MARQPESKLQAKIKKALKTEFGGKWVKLHGGPFQESGWPDIIGCCRGMFFGIEVKVPGGALDELQIETLKDLASEGACAIVVESIEQTLELVASHLKRNAWCSLKATQALTTSSGRLRSKRKNRRSLLQAASGQELDRSRRNRT